MAQKSEPLFTTSARSVVGLVRSGNEDSALIHSRLIAVADGMGGHAGGEVASASAITTLSQLCAILDSGGIDPDSAEDLLVNSLDDIDAEIGRVASHDSDLTGMGTTLSALMLYNNGENVALLHIGDSRCYRLRGNELTQLTRDHTVLQELLEQGALTAQEVREHPQRSLLTQAIMGEGSLAPALMVYEIETGDRFLLCSDGLSSVVGEYEIKVGLAISDREEAVAFLIDATYASGAPDNVTVVISDIQKSTNVHDVAIFLGAAV